MAQQDTFNVRSEW